MPMPPTRKRVRARPVHAEGVGDAGEDEEDAGGPEDEVAADRQLERAEQDQEDRHVLGEIGVGAHPAQQHLVAAVAEADLERPPQPADPQAQPDVEDGGRAGHGQGDRQDHECAPLADAGFARRARCLQPEPKSL